MTEATTNMLIGSVTTTVASLIGLVAVWMNLRSHQDRNAARVEADVEVNTQKTEANGRKADVIVEKTTQIEVATNGTLHEMVAHAKVQVERMAGLEKQIAMLLEDKQAKAEIAKTLAGEVKADGGALEADTEAVVENTEATEANSEVRAADIKPAIKPKKWG